MLSYKSKTGSCTGLISRNGELIAVAHKTSGKSFDKDAESEKTSTMRLSYKDPNLKQALEKYDPNALRNRLPVNFDGAAKPFLRFCHPRNQHTYDFMKGNTPPGYNPYKTTSGNFFNYDTKALEVGQSNQGIVSERVRVIHEQQLM